MKIQLLIILTAGLLISGIAQSHEVTINARFSGNEHPTMIDTNDDGGFASAGDFKVRGAPGKGVTHSFTEFTPWAPVGAEPTCSYSAELVAQDFVETLEDGSMIFFMATAGHTSADFCTGVFEGYLEGIVIGGTGRFEGATGFWEMTFTPYPLPNGMTAFTGSITGTIELP